MINIHMVDVGDGFCLGLYRPFKSAVIIDCGSLQGRQHALSGLCRLNRGLGIGSRQPYTFVLSHFHSDHYNGLVELMNKTSGAVWPKLRIESIFYPGIPKILGTDDGLKFYEALFSVNFYLLGSKSGDMRYDPLTLMRRISNIKNHRPLFKGDLFTVGPDHFEAVWPPRNITIQDVAARVKRAIEAFEQACKKVPELSEIHKWIETNNVLESYAEPGEMQSDDVEHPAPELPAPLEEGQLPEIVQKANKLLKKAANDLCLGFYQDSRLLFLGDFEEEMLPTIVEALTQKNRTEFEVLVAPHHGSHWHNSMRDLNADIVLVSNGPVRHRNFKSKLKQIANSRVLVTHTNGDIRLQQLGYSDFPWPFVRKSL